MTKVFFERLLMIFATSLLVLGSASGQSQKQPRPKHPPTDSDMQREMQSAIPGPAHKRLAALAGDYSTSTKFYIQPSDKPAESIGSATIKSVLDGMFLLEENSGTFMGQPMSGMRLLGYNNASKRYEAIWTYTMSTAILNMTGTSNDDGKTINFTASWDEGGTRQALQVTTKQIDDDQFSVEMSSKAADGKPGPRFVTTYTRKN